MTSAEAYRHLDEAMVGTTRDKVEPLVSALSSKELSALYLRSRRAQTITIAAMFTVMPVLGIVGGALFAAWMRTFGLEVIVGPEMRNLLVWFASFVVIGAHGHMYWRKHRRRMYMLDAAIKLQRDREYRVQHSGQPVKTVQ